MKDLPSDGDDRVSVSLTEFYRLAGIGRQTTYNLINSGEIEAASIGTKRLVILASWRRYLDRHRTRPNTDPAKLPPDRRKPDRLSSRG